MYVPSHFAEERKEVLHALIRAYPLGVLVASGAGGLEANHIPFVLQETACGSVTLSGHVARANCIWKCVEAVTPALAIFQGPAAYVRPGWYPSKQEHGRVVPTWNYVAVHARGVIRFHHDAFWIRNHLERITHQMEAGRSTPWAVDDAPTDYVEAMAARVVGVELVVEQLVGKWKLSQNQPESHRAGVVQGLEREGHSTAADLARLVREWSPPPPA